MKARLHLFVVLLLISSLSVSAQDSSSTSYQSQEFFPKKGDIGTTLLVGGLIDNIQLESPSTELGDNLLFVRYYLEDDLVLRLGLGFNLQSFKQEIADSVDLTLVSGDSATTRYTLNISGGIEKHLPGSKRLDPYVFGMLNLTFIGKENTDINVTVSSAAGEGRVERVIKKDGGFGIGIVAGAGFNYFLAKRLSVGTELGLIFQYSNIGGTTSDNTITTPISGGTISDFNTSDDQIQRTDISVSTNALINFSYFF